MTYCIGVLVNDGIVMASDSRTHAGVDNFATFCKMTVFDKPGDRVIILLSSGNLAGTQAVIGLLRKRAKNDSSPAGLWASDTMFDVAALVADAVRDVERRDSEALSETLTPFNASFIIGGQIRNEPMRLFRTFAEGNFIEAGTDTPFFQTGEAKYGKPIIDRVITPATSLPETMKCVLISFDSTMRSNLSVGMPIDLACYRRDSLAIRDRYRFPAGDPYFAALSQQWSQGVKQVFRQMPEVPTAEAMTNK